MSSSNGRTGLESSRMHAQGTKCRRRVCSSVSQRRPKLVQAAVIHRVNRCETTQKTRQTEYAHATLLSKNVSSEMKGTARG
eukprot:2289367-Pleurochrysis_carterae.AAC.1